MQAPKTGNPALRNGLIFGLILAALNIANVILQWVTGSYAATVTAANNAASGTSSPVGNGAATALGCLLFLVALALCFIAGMNTSRATGKVGSGAIAGLITGLVGEIIGGIISVVVVLVLVVPNINIPTGGTVSQSTIVAILIGTVVLGLILGLIIDGGIGAGVGALGGLVGKNNYRGPVAGYQESMYQGIPGQPGGYPPQQPAIRPAARLSATAARLSASGVSATARLSATAAWLSASAAWLSASAAWLSATAATTAKLSWSVALKRDREGFFFLR